ncbi:MAG: hypothetical protein M3081_20135 [Gemmatimonadota bacterium]|nr:hypothetical protein [Gemmatimonadota bacterium]
MIDPPNGVFGSSDVVKMRMIGGTMISNFLSCGNAFNGPRANSDRIRLSVQTTVKPNAAGSSSVATNLSAVAQNSESSSNNSAACATTGVLEDRINSSIKAKVLAQ